MKYLNFLGLIAGLLISLSLNAHAQARSLTIKHYPPLDVTFTPPSPVTLDCTAGIPAAGTFVTALSPVGGNPGKTYSYTITGDTLNFALDTTGTKIIVTAGMLTSGFCTSGIDSTLTVTPHQP